MKRVLLQPAFVLHRRPYRETSFLVELFTPEHGRLSVVARSVRKIHSSTNGLLQAFTPLLVSWSGKNELMTLTHVEAQAKALHLQGDCLFAGFYLNELLMYLLQKWEAQPGLFQAYRLTLDALATDTLEEKVLRAFEKRLLEELGYAPLPKSDALLQNMLLADKYYRFIPEVGFVLSDIGEEASTKSNIFSGKNLLGIAKEDWQNAECLQDAKRLMRFVLAPLLGNRQLYSRRLFLSANEGNKNES